MFIWVEMNNIPSKICYNLPKSCFVADDDPIYVGMFVQVTFDDVFMLAHGTIGCSAGNLKIKLIEEKLYI